MNSIYVVMKNHINEISIKKVFPTREQAETFIGNHSVEDRIYYKIEYFPVTKNDNWHKIYHAEIVEENLEVKIKTSPKYTLHEKQLNTEITTYHSKQKLVDLLNNPDPENKQTLHVKGWGADKEQLIAELTEIANNINLYRNTLHSNNEEKQHILDSILQKTFKPGHY